MIYLLKKIILYIFKFSKFKIINVKEINPTARQSQDQNRQSFHDQEIQSLWERLDRHFNHETYEESRSNISEC